MAKYFTKDGDNYVEVGDPLLPQADVDGIVEKRLERERGKFADYDALKEKAGKVDSIKTEYEDKLKAAGTTKSELEASLAKANLETDKVKIVHEFGLKDDLHEFVVGETADEMRQRAEKLSKGITGGGVVIDKNTRPENQPSDSQKIAGNLFGTKSD